jgi:hypothetical protein
LHGTGRCQKGEHCKFSHTLLKQTEIMKFIEVNEDFLLKTLQETGRTNLGNFLTSYLEKKKE